MARLRRAIGLGVWALTMLLPLAAAQAHDPAPAAEAEAEAPIPLSDSQGDLEAAMREFIATPEFAEEMQDAIAPVFAEMMRPGELVEGWQDTGIDLVELLSALPGGLDENVLVSRESEIPSIAYFSEAAGPARDPVTQFEISQSDPGEAFDGSLIMFGSDIQVDASAPRDRRGNAHCYSGNAAARIVSNTPIADWSEPQFIGAVAATGFVREGAKYAVCQAHHLRDDGGVEASSYTPDGRRLPMMDAQKEIFDIVRVEEIPAFLASHADMTSPFSE